MQTNLDRFRNRSEILSRIRGAAIAIVIYADSLEKAFVFAAAFGHARARERILLVDLGALERDEVERLHRVQQYYDANGMVDGVADPWLFAEIIVRGCLPVSMVNTVSECKEKLATARMNLWRSVELEEREPDSGEGAGS